MATLSVCSGLFWLTASLALPFAQPVPVGVPIGVPQPVPVPQPVLVQQPVQQVKQQPIVQQPVVQQPKTLPIQVNAPMVSQRIQPVVTPIKEVRVLAMVHGCRLDDVACCAAHHRAADLPAHERPVAELPHHQQGDQRTCASPADQERRTRTIPGLLDKLVFGDSLRFVGIQRALLRLQYHDTLWSTSVSRSNNVASC